MLVRLVRTRRIADNRHRRRLADTVDLLADQITLARGRVAGRDRDTRLVVGVALHHTGRGGERAGHGWPHRRDITAHNRTRELHVDRGEVARLLTNGLGCIGSFLSRDVARRPTLRGGERVEERAGTARRRRKRGLRMCVRVRVLGVRYRAT